MLTTPGSKPAVTVRLLRRVSTLNVTVIFLLCYVFAPGVGSTQHEHHPPPEKQDREKSDARQRTAIPDVEVVDQDGKRLRFYTDLVKGKVIAINFIFTSCTYICPLQGESFSKLQTLLGERLGRDVYLVSVSTDPMTDTPERLKTWANRFGAKTGWTFVTGDSTSMDKLLMALTGDVARKGEHSPIVLIGDYDKGGWVRGYALAEPERFVTIFQSLTKAGQ